MDLAEQWVLFYWPLVDSRELMPQINGESTGGKPIAFRSALSELTEHFSRQGGLNGFARVKADRLLSLEEQRLYGRVLRIVSSTIVKGPVKYAGGAREELTLMGHWIRDAVVLRWADMTWRLSAGVLPRGKILDRLVLTSDPARFVESVRLFYAGQRPGLECVWTGRRLMGDFDVDHAIPFALWQDSSLRNLFPAARSVNNQKRDKLPSREIVRRRSEGIVENWRCLSREFPSRFVQAAAALSEGAAPVGAVKAAPSQFMPPLVPISSSLPPFALCFRALVSSPPATRQWRPRRFRKSLPGLGQSRFVTPW